MQDTFRLVTLNLNYDFESEKLRHFFLEQMFARLGCFYLYSGKNMCVYIGTKKL